MIRNAEGERRWSGRLHASKHAGVPAIGVAIFGVVAGFCLADGALRIGAVAEQSGKAEVTFEGETGVYVWIWATDSLTGTWRLVGMELGRAGQQTWVDPLPVAGARFYRVGKSPVSDPGDADGDGLSTKAEIIQYRTDPLRADTDGDGAKDGAEVGMGKNPLVADQGSGSGGPWIEIISPQDGEHILW